MSKQSRDVLEREQEATRELLAMSNWGRWGEEDERGALNEVTLESIRRGMTCVRSGRIFPLGLHVRENRVPLLDGRPAPQHFMGIDGGDWAAGAGAERATQVAEDTVVIGAHGTTTHLDALCHLWADHKMYNGFSGNLVRSYGAMKLGIENVEGIVTRGVLLDIARYRGVDVMDPDDLVTESDVEGCLRDEGLSIERGDAVIVRTGWTKMFFQNRDAYSGMQPGIGASAAVLLARAAVCLVGSDNTSVEFFSGYNPRYTDRAYPPDPRGEHTTVHVAFLRNLGIYLLEMLTLEGIAGEGVHEFLFCVAPLLIKGGTASPVNPLAVA